MPRGGHNKRPTAIKKAEGTLNVSRQVENEFTPTRLSVPPPPPEHYDERTKKRWRVIAKEMCDAMILHNVDVQVLENYCELYERYLRFQDLMDEHGEIVITDKGNLVVNPATVQYLNCHRLMISYSAGLGLGAANRIKIGTPDVGESKLKQLLKTKPA